MSTYSLGIEERRATTAPVAESLDDVFCFAGSIGDCQ